MWTRLQPQTVKTNRLSGSDNETLPARQVQRKFFLIGKELVHSFPRARTTGKTVVVEDHDSAALQSGVKKNAAVFHRLVDVRVHVDQAEPEILDGSRGVRKEAWIEANIVTIAQVTLDSPQRCVS